MSDWLKVFTFPPGAVVLLVNEHREQPDYSGFVIRSELRFRGRIIIQHHQQIAATERFRGAGDRLVGDRIAGDQARQNFGRVGGEPRLLFDFLALHNLDRARRVRDRARGARGGDRDGVELDGCALFLRQY